MNGKISHLPQSVREQLNRRLSDGERPSRTLAWLNSLPDVQALIASEFAGRPVSKQNLYEWTRHGFRQWKLRQNALDFATQNLADAPAADSCSTSNLTQKLVQWLALRFAASAHTLVPADDEPETDLRCLRQIAADIVALRRGDLYSRRVALEEKRLALRTAKTQELREEEFWQWTRRRDIRARLETQMAQQRAWHDQLRAAIPELAPFLPPKPQSNSDPDETSTPAALI